MSNAAEKQVAQVREINHYSNESSQQIGSIMMNPELLNQAMVMAEQMANSTFAVPDHFKNKPGDCYAIVLQALQWRMNPFIVAQKTHIVNGKIGYEAQLVNALVTAGGYIKGTFKYEYKGDGNTLECRVGAVIRGESEITWGEWLAFSNVTVKNSPLWKNNVKQQIGYLQVKNFSRLYFPAAIMGVYTADELNDSPEQPREPKDIGGGRAEPDSYPDEKFEENLPAWKDLVQSGKRTPDQILKMVSSKATLTQDQQDAIKALK
ncbi:MAG: recombinase RecT [Gammaproteobacteria bacterium]|nr:recombinase RecT [Gammaproteobacteria bacterium]MBU1834189.1 recombinase RecT [Gammaproteobacteria bacterium]